MNVETISLYIGLWGAFTGTLALLIQYLGHLSDKSSLYVEATMFYGNCAFLGTERGYHINLRLVNRGRRIVRIRTVALRIKAPWRVALNGLLFRYQLTKNIVQPDIGIYNGVVDPIHEFSSDSQNKKTYPPKTIILDESQMVELQLVVSESLLPLLPKRKAWVVVTDHVGIKYKAKYFPIPFCEKMKDEQQTQKPVNFDTGKAACKKSEKREG